MRHISYRARGQQGHQGTCSGCLPRHRSLKGAPHFLAGMAALHDADAFARLFFRKGHRMTTQPFAIIEEDFADGTYKFALNWSLATEWEKTTERSLYATLMHVMRTGVANLNDARELVRLGLIGGGTAPKEALRLVRTYVEERPAAENFDLVVRIVDAFFHGKGVPDAAADDAAQDGTDG
ncbi:gene transfer agent family protein [Rhizobium pusense]|uniref:gene transfer agent family protein n=2 Tax=Agrobacterium pusense TaxID=648995 RepID=UPI0009FA3C50